MFTPRSQAYDAFAYQPQLCVVVVVQPQNAHFLTACLNSLKQQDYAAMQVIIAAANGWAAKENLDTEGLQTSTLVVAHWANAANEAIKQHMAHYYCFLDANEGLSPDAIAQLLTVLQNENEKDRPDWLAGTAVFKRENGSIINQSPVKKPKLLSRFSLAEGYWLHDAAVWYSRRALNSVGRFKAVAVPKLDYYIRLEELFYDAQPSPAVLAYNTVLANPLALNYEANALEANNLAGYIKHRHNKDLSFKQVQEVEELMDKQRPHMQQLKINFAAAKGHKLAAFGLWLGYVMSNPGRLFLPSNWALLGHVFNGAKGFHPYKGL